VCVCDDEFACADIVALDDTTLGEGDVDIDTVFSDDEGETHTHSTTHTHTHDEGRGLHLHCNARSDGGKHNGSGSDRTEFVRDTKETYDRDLQKSATKETHQKDPPKKHKGSKSDRSDRTEFVRDVHTHTDVEGLKEREPKIKKEKDRDKGCITDGCGGREVLGLGEEGEGVEGERAEGEGWRGKRGAFPLWNGTDGGQSLKVGGEGGGRRKVEVHVVTEEEEVACKFGIKDVVLPRAGNPCA